jgi:hypothetical protein
VIRYVVAVALAVALLGFATVAVDHGTAARSEAQVESALDTVDSAATSLVENERPPVADERPPRRLVEITLPGDRFLASAPARLGFRRVSGADATRVTYRIEGETAETETIDAPLQRGDASSFALDGHTGRLTLLLRLVRVDGEAVVDVTVDQ